MFKVTQLLGRSEVSNLASDPKQVINYSSSIHSFDTNLFLQHLFYKRSCLVQGHTGQKNKPWGKKRKRKEDQFLSLFAPHVEYLPYFVEPHKEQAGPARAIGGRHSLIQSGFCHLRTQAQFCQIRIFQEMPKIQVFSNAKSCNL